jgi:polysaccharide biosynthesis transport protein
MSTLPPFPPTPPAQGVEPAPFQWMPAGVAFFRRQARPVIGCAILGIVLGVAYLATATPKYTAVATVVFDSHSAHPVGNQQAAPDWQTQSAYVDSEVELLRSPGTLRVVVDTLHLDRNPLFVPTVPGPIGRLIAAVKQAIPGVGAGNVPLDPEAQAKARATAALSGMLEVSRVGATSVIDVSVRTPDRALSAQVANAITDAYMAQQLVAISDTTKRAGVWLQGRVGDLRTQAVDADRAVQEYKAKNNIVDVGTSSGVGLMNEQELGELNQQVTNAQTHLAETQARYARAQASTVNGVTAGMLPDALHEQVMVGLLQQYSDAARREADLKARMGPTHGAVILQHNAVMEIQHNIQTELDRLIETYRSDFEVAQTNVQALQAQLNERIKAAGQTNIQRSELRSLESSAQAYRQIYENFLQRFTQAMQDQSYPISDARVSTPALPPMDRSSPRTAIVLALALTLGTALGVAIAVTREAMDDTVHTIRQMMEATGLDSLGAVAQSPVLAFRRDWRWKRHIDRARNRGKRGELLVPAAFREAMVNPDCDITEAVHAVHVAAARQSARGREVRVIGCVSATGKEGTSTFAANLAFAMASTGLRTILVDWNTDAPLLTETLSPNHPAGLQELAAREATLSEVTVKDAETGLRFIGQSPGGKRRFPPKLEHVRAMLTDLRLQYDVVVLDLPPMQASSTAVRLSDLVDGFVLVTRWGGTPQSLLSEALARTATVDALFLGAVLNRCSAKRMRLYPSATRAPAARLPVPVTLDA